ncbi:MAG TPA: ATP-binding cassette domain-containing protein, partial [Longimicrobiales bacterium]
MASSSRLPASRPDTAERAAHAVEVVGLRKRYEDVVAVDGIDLTVGWGEVFGLLGPNGAGKTTTVEI